MGHPRERVPVRRLPRRQRPAQRFAAQTRLHVRVRRHIVRIIVVDEIVPDRPREQQQRAEKQRERDHAREHDRAREHQRDRGRGGDRSYVGAVLS